jgi:hypothetical protein
MAGKTVIAACMEWIMAIDEGMGTPRRVARAAVKPFGTCRTGTRPFVDGRLPRRLHIELEDRKLLRRLTD